MLELLDYILAAKSRHGLESDYGLARLLGIDRQKLATYLSGKVLPREVVMLRLGSLAGVSSEQAILDLARWRANKANAANAANIITKIANKVGANEPVIFDREMDPREVPERLRNI
ncbi:hypothetical protein ABWI00_06085 [Algihabitans albus]|uniref:hypothetical protein n=1 Tax=Algihabitans albus TaxID=2164067 RepID=UPI0035CEC99E